MREGASTPRYRSDRTGLQQHDSANFGTGCTYRGNATSVTRLGITSTVQYDITGTVSSATQGGLTIAYAPDPTHNNTVPSAITPNGDTAKQTTMQYNSFLGLTNETGPNNATSSMTYDAYARPASATSPHGAGAALTYSVAGTYPAWTQSRTNYIVAIPGGGGGGTVDRVLVTTYDGFGRPIKVETKAGSTLISTVETEYEACACSPMGKVKKVSRPYAPGGIKCWTEYFYDELGRTTEVKQPANAGSTLYAYAPAVGANQVKSTDPAGKWKTFTTNALGELVTVTEPNPAGGGTWDTAYTYSTLGKLLTVTMVRPSGTQTRTFSYNSLGQLQSATNPETGTVSYTYNSNGQIATKIDAKNQKVAYSYELTFQRLASINRYPTATGSADPNQNMEIRYDTDLDPNCGVNAQGRPAKVTQQSTDENGQNMSFTECFNYTAAGALAKKKLTVNKKDQFGNYTTASLEATMDYDGEGQMLAQRYPATGIGGATAGPRYKYTLDALARYTGMTQEGVSGSIVSGVAYNAASQMTQMTYEGWTETRQYNELNQLKRITVPGAADWEYTFSATQNNGRITKAKDWVTGEEVNYTYDALNRLIAASTTGTGWGLSFGYDGFGNKLTQALTKGSGPTHSFTVNASTNPINGFTYDANGNQSPASGSVYDIENRLRQYQTGGQM